MNLSQSQRSPSGLGWPLRYFGVTLFLISGCGDLIPPRPPIRPTQPVAEPTGEPDLTTNVPPAEVAEPELTEFEGYWSEWYVYRFAAQVVGTTVVSAESLIGQDVVSSEVQYRREEQLLLRSGRVSFVQLGVVSCDESTEGELLRFRSETQTGPLAAVVSGTRSNDALSVRRATDGDAEVTRLPWSDGNRGLFAIEQSLRRKPMSVGQTRRFQVLAPSLRAVGVIEMRCRGESSVAMLDGSYRVLPEIDVVTYQDGQQVDLLVVWTDDQGVIEKTLRPNLRLESYRTDRSTAERLFAETGHRGVTVPFAGTLRPDGDPTRVVFQLTWTRSNESDEQPTALTPPQFGNQSVETEDDRIVVSVRKRGLRSLGDLSDSEPLSEDDRRSTEELNFGDTRVKRLADSVGDLPAERLIAELTRTVKNTLSRSPQQKVQSASQTLASGKGGPLDRAIVLAALLRARGIPARVATGLVCEPTGDSSVMRLAAWVFASVEDGWLSVDPVSGKPERADRLCLDLVCGDQSIADAYANVFRELSRLEIEITDAEYP